MKTTTDELRRAYIDFARASSMLLEAIDADKNEHSACAADYPFERSFDDQHYAIAEWVNTSLERLENTNEHGNEQS